ncbi:MAG: peptidoglycan DD-metalloendopeptidase family protein [Bacteroidales bacterium]|nr:peptidoglycan DD-metalloendopeptidase family protein [Bacteroidales bacterium]
MSEKVKTKKRFTKLRYKYRLVLINEENFEQRLSFRLSRLNVYFILASISIFWIASMIYLLAYTSLREYIPGYTDPGLKHQIYNLNLTLDSLENKLHTNDLYLKNIRRVLEGEDFDLMDSVETKQQIDYQFITNEKTKDDSLLRQELEDLGKYNIYYHETDDVYNVSFSKGAKVYFSPLNGIITNHFDANNSHYGIDIVAKRNDAIKVIDDGIVVLAEWTINTGYVIAIQHPGNILSIYKHNSSLLKKSGEYVKAGDLIAIIGNSGEMSSGPHLHFELWVEGSVVNPLDYISF